MKIARSNLHNTRLPKVSFVLTGQATLESLSSRAEPRGLDGRTRPFVRFVWENESGGLVKAAVGCRPQCAEPADQRECSAQAKGATCSVFDASLK